ncbi:hypothetical protein [Pseudoalteromonas sp. McH1-42]|uniref:hypothetical protein n=1 Tax=Pseudoalteromonas sp. McH1-42 TaxID=2917752 RepID=UPI001EF58437|nr:hypothetical protein [Pseudoalteromonas sp. McH1-42]MCG7562407.1 hypothetical protein [Pseudoalteromonas sp. McH1-42]
MKFKYISFILMALSLNGHAGMWAWENNGATKWLNGYPECQSYFSLKFAEKVAPKSATHFEYQATPYQIVAIPIASFTDKDAKKVGIKSILESHLEHEFNYLKHASKDHSVTVHQQAWLDGTELLYWHLKRHNDTEESHLVSLSTLSDLCVFYIVSMIESEDDIASTKENILSIIRTLDTHVPTSQTEFEALISQFKPNKG